MNITLWPHNNRRIRAAENSYIELKWPFVENCSKLCRNVNSIIYPLCAPLSNTPCSTWISIVYAMQCAYMWWVVTLHMCIYYFRILASFELVFWVICRTLIDQWQWIDIIMDLETVGSCFDRSVRPCTNGFCLQTNRKPGNGAMHILW